MGNNIPGKKRRGLITWVRETLPAEPLPEADWKPATNVRPMVIPDVAPEWSGATETDIAAGAADKAKSRTRIIERIGNHLEAWLAFYVAERGPLDRSTLKGWRLSLRWFNRFCGRLAELDDLSMIGKAESFWLDRGDDPGTVRLAIAKLKALERFAAECGAVDLPNGKRHHWRIRVKPGAVTGRRVVTANCHPQL